MTLSLVTGPADLPLDINEVKAHLRVEDDQNDEDALILTYLRAAVDHVDGRDGILGRALITQTWDQTLDEFPAADFIRLSLAPVQSITSITYTDENGDEQTFAASNYSLSADKVWRPRVDLAFDKSWPGTRNIKDAVTVRFVAGYGTRNDVPQPIRNALLLLTAHWYENREPVMVGQSVADIPMAVDSLLSPYRVASFG